MAALENIRNQKYLLIGVIGVALLAFIIGGVFQAMPSLRGAGDTMVKVEGEEIGYNEDFYPLYENQHRNAQSRSADGTVSDIQDNQMRKQVVDMLVNQVLLDQIADKVGFAVGKEEFNDLVLGDNISPVLQQQFMDPQTGQVNKAQLINIVQLVLEGATSDDPQEQAEVNQIRAIWNQIETEIIKQQVSGKIYNFLSSAITMNAVDRQVAYNNTKTSVDFDYVAYNYTSISDEGIEVSDAELQTLYDQKKNRYPQKEARVIDYILLEVTPSEKDLTEARMSMNDLKTQLEETANVAPLVSHYSTTPYVSAYRSFATLNNDEKQFVENNEVGTVSSVMQRGVNFTLLKYEDAKVAPDTVSMNILNLGSILDQAMADSLMNVVRTTSFSEMALAATEGQSDGSFGDQTETSLLNYFDEDFKNKVYEAPLNEVLLISSPQRGAFLVEVTKKSTPIQKYKIASITKTVVPGNETQSETYNRLSQYVSKYRDDLEAFRDSAIVNDFYVVPDLQVTKESFSINNVNDTRKIVQWAFKVKKGAVSNIFRVDNSKYLAVAALQDEYQEGVRPLKDVEAILKQEIINQKKAEKILAELNGKSYSTLEQYAEAWNVTPNPVIGVSFGMTSPISGIGSEPVVYAEAPLMNEGQLSKPLVGQRAVYVLNVTAKNEKEAYNDETMKMQVESQNQRTRSTILNNQNLFKENKKIEDRTIDFPLYEENRNLK
jgi:hypothetical protein